MAVMPFSPKSAPWFNWTRGIVTHSGDRTAARYTIKEIKGAGGINYYNEKVRGKGVDFQVLPGG